MACRSLPSYLHSSLDSGTLARIPHYIEMTQKLDALHPGCWRGAGAMLKYYVQSSEQLSEQQIEALVALRKTEFQIKGADDVKAGTTHILGVESDAIVAGVEINYNDGFIYVKRLIVSVDARGRGNARRLMEMAADHARAKGYTEIRILGRTNLIPFYNSLGYIAAAPEYYRADVDVWLIDMRLRLTGQAQSPTPEH